MHNYKQNITSGSLVNTMIITLMLVTGLLSPCHAQRFTSFWNGKLLKGNTIEFSALKFDTTSTLDPETGEREVNNSSVLPRPARMNGKEIQHASVNEQGTFPQTIAKAGDHFFKYLTDSLKPLLEQLGDGEYRYSPFFTIFNEKGELVYYDLQGGITKSVQPFPGATFQQMELTRQIDPKLKDVIDKKIISLVEGYPLSEILAVGGIAMPYDVGSYFATIRNHHVQE